MITQITLDPILIFGFGLGVRGAALGTVGGQAVSMGMSLWFFFAQPRRPYRIRLADLRPHGPTVREVVTLGAPSFLAGFGATLLVALANNLLAGAGGTVALAAFALCARIGTFVAMPQLGIAQGLQPVAGYNAGLGAMERVERATTLTLRATAGYGTAICAIIIVLAGPLTALFTNDPAVHEQAATALRILALAYPLAGIAPLISARFQALGNPRPSYLISIGTLIAIKIPFLVAFSRYGQSGLWWSFPAAELATAAVALLILRRRPATAG